jgi:ABC-2 type transport system permease protein
MKQFFYILKREISVKLKSKSFYLFVFVSPVLFLIPVTFSLFNKPETVMFTEKNLVGIYSNDFINDTVDFRGIKFYNLSENEIEKFNMGKFDLSKYLGIVDLHTYDLDNASTNALLKFYMNEKDLINCQKYVKDVESFINQEVIYDYAQKLHLSDSISYNLSNLKNIYPIVYANSDSVKSETTASFLAYILGMLLYIMFILYNNNILKSVFEEKNNKLAEVLSIFVKPLNLMLGKIIGQGLASLFQLLMWIVVFYFYFKIILWYNIYFIGNSEFGTNFMSVSLSSISDLPILNLCLYLPLFFIFGFLINGAISTIIAIYSGRKNSNYLMFFGNILNLLSIYFGMYVATSPNAQISVFLSYFPIFSYLTIPVLLPYGIPTIQIVVSLFILIFTVTGLLFFSGFIYKKSIRV